MPFPDWVAIIVLLFLLVWAVSAWIQQRKSQQTKASERDEHQ
jgi:hypothetical protein